MVPRNVNSGQRSRQKHHQRERLQNGSHYNLCSCQFVQRYAADWSHSDQVPIGDELGGIWSKVVEPREACINFP
jgi:hypothetical protein